MTHPRTMSADSLHGLHVVDDDGSKIGKVSGVYLDAENNRPEWAAVKTGALGGHETLVPLVDATATDNELRVPYAKDKVSQAPHHDPDVELSNDDEAQLFTYYGVPYAGETVTAQPTGTAQGTRDANRVQDVSGPNTDSAMTRSEERLQVGTQRVEAGRARLVKHIVTENVTTSVPVSHEEVRVTREPITEANRAAAMDGPALSEEEAEVTLHAERPVVAKETVPVERVRLATETVTGQQQIDEAVRKEVIETDGATTPVAGEGTGTRR